MNVKNKIILLSLIFPLFCYASLPIDVPPPGKIKCYGVADSGQNDGPFMADYPEAAQGAGGAKYPCERTAWRWMPKDKCLQHIIGFTTVYDENNNPSTITLYGTLEPRAPNLNPDKCQPYTVFGNQDDSPSS